MRLGERKVTKEKFHAVSKAAKKPIKIWDVNVDNIVIPKLVSTKYLIGYLDKAIRLLFGKITKIFD